MEEVRPEASDARELAAEVTPEAADEAADEASEATEEAADEASEAAEEAADEAPEATLEAALPPEAVALATAEVRMGRAAGCSLAVAAIPAQRA